MNEEKAERSPFTLEMKKNAHYVVYSKPDCLFCDQAKALLESLNLEFTVCDVSEAENLKYLKKVLPTAKTVPQIFMLYDPYVGYIHIGGFAELVKELQDLVIEHKKEHGSHEYDDV